MIDTSNCSEDDKIKLLTRLDPEVWFMLHGVLKDKEGKVMAKRKPNMLQKRMFEGYRTAIQQGKPFRCLGLKPRQVGLSTIVAAITYHHMRNHPNLSGALMADKVGTADMVFEIYRTFAENDSFDWGKGSRLAPFGQPGNLANEIVLPNGSAYRKETAGSARAGAGGTLQVANGTEVAHYPVIQGKDPALGFLNSWYDQGLMSLGMFDTTPNGPRGMFYDLWINKKNGYCRIFAAWFEFPEHSIPFKSDAERAAFALTLDDNDHKDYEERQEIELWGVTLEQLNWRRHTIGTKCEGDVGRFRQEYPSDDVSAFLLNARPRFRPMRVKQIHDHAMNAKPRKGELTLHDNRLVTWCADEEGTIDMIEEPRIGCRYSVTMDTCTGRDQQVTSQKADPDYHSICVTRDAYTDYNTREHYPPRIVMHHYSRLEADIAANVAVSMAYYYGNCMIIPEVNNCGHYHVKEMERLEATVYERVKRNKTAGTEDRMKGWMTDSVTRKTILTNLAVLIKDWTPEKPTFLCEFPWITEQLATFVRDKSGHAAAMPGKHDDGVMMLAIALANLTACSPMKEPKVRQMSVEKINRLQGWRVA
jgi:hypothetical protein